jgi:hypothetical protein
MVGYNKKGEIIATDIFSKKKSNAFPVGIGADKYGNVYVGGSLGSASAVIKYGIKKTGCTTETSTLQIINELKLFPNPVGSSLNITFTTTSPANRYWLVISDVSGNTIVSKQLEKPGKIITTNINVQQLKPGIYTANITNGINSVSKTFIKE